MNSRSAVSNCGHTTDPTDQFAIGRRYVISVTDKQSTSNNNYTTEFNKSTANAKSITISWNQASSVYTTRQSLANRDNASVGRSAHPSGDSGLRQNQWHKSGQP